MTNRGAVAVAVIIGEIQPVSGPSLSCDGLLGVCSLGQVGASCFRFQKGFVFRIFCGAPSCVLVISQGGTFPRAP